MKETNETCGKCKGPMKLHKTTQERGKTYWSFMCPKCKWFVVEKQK